MSFELPLSVDVAERWHAIATTHQLINSTTHYSVSDPPMDPYHIFNLLDGSKLFQTKLAQCPIPIEILAAKSSSFAPPHPPDLDPDLTCKHLTFSLLDWRSTAEEDAEKEMRERGIASSVDWVSFFNRANDELTSLLERPREFQFRQPNEVPADVPASFGVDGFASAVFWLCVVLQTKAEREQQDLDDHGKPGMQHHHQHSRHLYDAEVGGRVWREALVEVLRPDEVLQLEMAQGSLGDVISPSTTTKSKTTTRSPTETTMMKKLTKSGTRVSLAALAERVGGKMKRSSCIVLAMLIRGDSGCEAKSELLEVKMLEFERAKRASPDPSNFIDDVAISIDDAMHLLCVRKAGDLDNDLLEDLVKWCRRRVARWIAERFSPLAFPSRGPLFDPTAKYYRPYLLRSFFRIVSTAVARVMTRMFSSSVSGGAVSGREAWSRIRQSTQPGGKYHLVPPEVVHADFVRTTIERMLLGLAALPPLAAMASARIRKPLILGTGTNDGSVSRQHQQQQQQQHRSGSPTSSSAAVVANHNAASSPRASAAASAASFREQQQQHHLEDWVESARHTMRETLVSALQVRKPNILTAAAGGISRKPAVQQHQQLKSDTNDQQRQPQRPNSAASTTSAGPAQQRSDNITNGKLPIASREAMRSVIDADHGELVEHFSELKGVVTKLDRARVQQLLQLQSAAKNRNKTAAAAVAAQQQHEQRQQQQAQYLLHHTLELVDADDNNADDNAAASAGGSDEQHRQDSPLLTGGNNNKRRAPQPPMPSRASSSCARPFARGRSNSFIQLQQQQQQLTQQEIEAIARQRANERAAANASRIRSNTKIIRPGTRSQSETRPATARCRVLDHKALSAGTRALLQDPDEFVGITVPVLPYRHVMKLTPREQEATEQQRDGLYRDAQCALARAAEAQRPDEAEREEEENRRLLLRFKRPVSMQAPADIARSVEVAVERAKAEQARARAQNAAARDHTITKLTREVRALMPIEDIAKRCTTGIRTQEFYAAVHSAKQRIDVEIDEHGLEYEKKQRAQLRVLAMEVNRIRCFVRRAYPEAVLEWEEFNITRV